MPLKPLPPPTKRTPQVLAALCGALEEGLTRRAACRVAGIVPSTLYAWMAEDEDVKDALMCAEDAAEVKLSRILLDAAPKDWRAAQVWLERRRPVDWSTTTKLAAGDGATAEITIKIGGRDAGDL